MKTPPDQNAISRLESLPAYWAGRAEVRRQLIAELHAAAPRVTIDSPASIPVTAPDMSGDFRLPMNLRGIAAGAIHREILRNTDTLRMYEGHVERLGGQQPDHQYPAARLLARPPREEGPIRPGEDLAGGV